MSINRHATVKLPDQMTNRENVAPSILHFPMWEQRRAWSMIGGDGVEFECGDVYGTCTSADARDLAAVLLSAAAYRDGLSGPTLRHLIARALFRAGVDVSAIKGITDGIIAELDGDR